MACTCDVTALSINAEPDEGEGDRKKSVSCSTKMHKLVRRRLPILKWLPKYKKGYILSDLIAGITVWLTAVPQSMANAGIAGLSPEYGLYSHFIGPFVYIFLGSCRQVTIGPTAVMSLLTFQTCGDDFPACVILFGFYAGLIELVFGLLQLGVVISFISEPVTVGFTAGAAVTIASTQIKSVLGLSGKPAGRTFIESWKHVFKYFTTIKPGDATLGLLCIAFLLCFRKLTDVRLPRGCGKPTMWEKVIRMLSLCRNALAISVSALVAYFWVTPPFVLTGNVRSGLPDVIPPSLQFPNPNSNSTEPMSFADTLKFVGTGPLTVAFVSILQNVAISKAFGSGQTIDGTQEMIALGVTNIIGGFFSCCPSSGSFSRSALNDASGVKTQMNGLFVGSLILLSLGILTPTFRFVPKSSLAAVIICAVLFMIDVETIIKIWKVSKVDFLCCLVTFLCSLGVGMEYGIVIGVGVNVLILLLKSLRPRITVHCLIDSETRVKYLLLLPDQGLCFPGVDFIRDKVNKAIQRYPDYPVMVVQCDKWTQWDYTAASSMVALGKNFEKMGKRLVLFKQPGSWNEAFARLEAQVPLCCGDSTQLYKVLNDVAAGRTIMNGVYSK